MMAESAAFDNVKELTGMARKFAGELLTVVYLVASLPLAQSEPSAPQDAARFVQAALRGSRAHEQLVRCRRFVAGWLAQADDVTGLIPRNLV